MRRFLSVICLSLVGGITTGSAAENRTNSTAPIHLAATKISATDIKLDWSDGQNVAGHIVEWTMEPNESYVILAFTQPEVTSFVHPDLAPQMKCRYRVRPYFGPASDPVEVTTGKPIPNEEVKLADETWATPKITAAGSAEKQFSMRNPLTISHTAPTGLKAKLVHPTGIQFTWIDHANDEEGYMLEMKTDADGEFHVCAIIDPNVTSYGYALAPPETKVYFRVRPFFYGEPSNLAIEKTGSASARPADEK